MASELRVNTLKDASGNNSIATSYVAGGSAKAWLNLDGSGTIATRDSLNVASNTDNGTGDYTTTFTSSFANNDYCHQHTNISADSQAQYGMTTTATFAETTTSIRQRNGHWSGASSTNASSSDSERHYICQHGDLA